MQNYKIRILKFCNTLTSLELPAGVSELADYVVANTPLQSLTVTPLIATIGNGAFDNCSQLSELTIEKSTAKLTLGKNDNREGLFHDCPINNLYIGRTLAYDTTEAAGYSPFYGNTGLKNVTVSDNAIAVPANMFANCTGLETVTLGEMVQSLGTSAFKNSGVMSINIPNAVTMIANSCFEECSRLTGITLHNRVSQIGQRAFAGSGLQSINVPGAVETISVNAFANTSQLRSVTLNPGTKTIDNYAFSNSALESLSVPNTVTAINTAAFDGVTRLSNLRFEDGTTTLALANSADVKGLFAEAPLTSLYIGRELSYNASAGFGYSPFYRNATLRSIEIGDIPSRVFPFEFYGCPSLNDIVMGDNVYEIGDYAFGGCTELTSFTVGSSIEQLGIGALSDCTKLEMLKTYSPIPPNCGFEALSDINKTLCVLHLPTGTVETYAAADQWNEFFFVEEFDAGVKVSYIELSQSSAVMTAGETLQLIATAYPEDALSRAVRWESADSSVATVSADGTVTAVEAGSTVITATAADGSGVTATCHIIVTLPAASDNYTFAIPDTEISKRKTTLVPVMMNNEKGISSLQCDIHLPAGLSIARNDYDLYDIRLSDRADNSFSASASDFNGAVRVLVYSNQNRTIKGNEGAIFYLPIEVTDDKAVNKTNYDLLIDGIYVTLLENFEEKAVDDIHGKLILVSYNIGDVNNDGRISAADVSLTVSYVLGGNPSNGIREAADANGDGRISAADVSIIVSYVLSGRQVNAPQRIAASNAEMTDAEQTSVEIDANGNLVVKATGLNMYTSAQFDLTIPEGVAVKSANLTDANSQSHTLAYRDNGDGTVRFLAYSADNSNFCGDDVLAVIELTSGKYANGIIKADNAYLAETRGNEIAEVAATASFAEIGTSAIFGAANEGLSVTVVDGGLLINADSYSVITIADIVGRVLHYSVYPGVNRINLEPGIYVINNNKIMIK